MAPRSEEIEREIEETRRDMTRTTAEIERRLSPDGLMNGAMTWLRTNPRGRAMTDDVMDVVGRNPLPIVLIGIGLGWLAWEMSNGGRRRLAGYTPMRRRLGPDPRPERHHMHVEDGGHSARAGRSPDPADIVGYRRGTESAREAAAAFRDMRDGEETYGGSGYGTVRGASGSSGAGAYGTASTGQPTGGYGPSVISGRVTAGSGSMGGSDTSPDPADVVGYRRGSESARDAARAFEDADRPGKGSASGTGTSTRFAAAAGSASDLGRTAR